LRAKQPGEPFDQAAYETCVATCVADIARKQAEAGVDVVSDGEFGKSISRSQYVLQRLSGFERRPIRTGGNPFTRGVDRGRFAEFYAELDEREGMATTAEAAWIGPIVYTGQAELKRDIANFKAALRTSISRKHFFQLPASVIPDRKNEYYKSEEELIRAIGSAMRTEYSMIIEAGFVLQLDDARAAVSFDRMVPLASFADYRKWLALQFAGLPRDRIRYHVCWGSWPGPHTSDVPLEDIVDLILSMKVGAFVIEGVNPRHEHEWRVWETAKPPSGSVLIPGVIGRSRSASCVLHGWWGAKI